MVILFDTRHLGNALYRARHSASINRRDTATLLGLTPGELRQYETGHAIMPVQIIEKLFRCGLVFEKNKH